MTGRRKYSPTSPASVSPAPWVVVSPAPGLAPVPSLTAAMPRQLSSRFSAADLPGQFVLSRSADVTPAGWAARTHQGWTLATHPWLRVATLRSVDGHDVGWVLGDPISESAAFLPDVVALPFDRFATAAEMETWLSALCGRFLAVWLTPVHERVYADAGGLLGAVFAPEQGLVASTPSLVPYSRGCDDDPDLQTTSRHPDGLVVLGFGLTPRRGVERLMPNHHLDLNRWTSHRYWPVAPLDDLCDPMDAIKVVSRMIRRHVAAGLRRGDVLMALTAGIDSRAVLASSREYVDRVELMTLAIPDRVGRLDVETARKMAALHGLRHRVLDHVTPTRDDLDAWLWRTGSVVSEPRGWRGVHAYGQAAPAAEVTGAGGEAARVAYWRDAASAKGELTAEVLVDCLKLPRTPAIVDRARAWMNGYPAVSPVQLLDGFFIENSLGVAASALAYGDAGSVRCRLYPFVNRPALEAMSRLPELYKLSRRFQHDLIRCTWPELMRTPVNRHAGLRHYVQRARRQAWVWRRTLASNQLSR